jgi:hypothetical protein
MNRAEGLEEPRKKIVTGLAGHVRFGSLTDILLCGSHIRFTRIADIPGGDQHVCFVPIADLCTAANAMEFRTDCNSKFKA